MSNAVETAKRQLRPGAKARWELGSHDAERKLKAEADEREAKAAIAALDLEIKRGEHMHISKIKDRDLARINATSRGIMALPRQIAARFGLDHVQEAEIEGLCRDLCERFSRM